MLGPMDRRTGTVAGNVAVVEFEGVEPPAPQRVSPMGTVAGVAVLVAVIAVMGPWGAPADRNRNRSPLPAAPSVAIPAALRGRSNHLAFATSVGPWYGARLRRLWRLDVRTGRLVSRGIGAAIRGRSRVFYLLDGRRLVSIGRLAAGSRSRVPSSGDPGLLWSASGRSLMGLDPRTGWRLELRLPPGLRAVGPVASA